MRTPDSYRPTRRGIFFEKLALTRTPDPMTRGVNLRRGIFQGSNTIFVQLFFIGFRTHIWIKLTCNVWRISKLEVHSVERIYLRQRCFNDSKPRVAAATGAQYGFSWRNKILHCSAYAMGESNPVPASGLWSGSGSKVNQFGHVPTSVDTQHFIQIHARVFE